MIRITIGSDGVPSERKVILGNKYENNDEMIYFSLPQDFDTYKKYVIAVMKVNGENVTRVLPINENIMMVSSSITYYSGNWSLYVMCRQTEIDLSNVNIDISAKDGEHVFISDGFLGIVNKSNIEKDAVDNIPLDSNLKIIYDDLLELKNQLLYFIMNGIGWDSIKNKPSVFPPEEHNHDSLYYSKSEIDEKLAGSGVNTSWDSITGKPESFPPSTHNHNDMYYTKSETDSLLPEKVAEKVVPIVAEEVVPEVVKEVVPEIALTPDKKITTEDIDALFN